MKRFWADLSICLVPIPTIICILFWVFGQTFFLQLNQKYWDLLFIDALSLTFLIFIAILGTLIYSFAFRNLKGDLHRTRFLFFLGSTLWVVQGLAVCGNFALFIVFWVMTSSGLHQLLQHFKHRPGAVIVAKEKFIISRLGDLALIAAGVLIYLHFHTLDFADWMLIFAQDLDVNVFPIAALLVIGALTKSAQVPFHAWLPRTLEAPTAVSALMHAGIINAGGYLLIRTYSLISHSESALVLLIGCGLVSSVWGILAMHMQADIKRRLAWSTIGQIGFMMIEIGAGLPGLALLHLIGHGLYKANSFLSSGQLLAFTSLRRSPSLANSFAGLGLWSLLSLVGIVAAAWFSPSHVLMAYLISSLLLPLIHVAVLQTSLRAMLKRLLVSLFVAVSSFIVGIYASFWFGLHESLPTEGLRIAVLTSAIVTFLLLSLMAVFQPLCQSWRWYQWLYAYGLHGFGFGRWPEALADRFLSKKERHI
jgi:NAD(P)H-quinone oxidoreductase subunit 5